MEEEGKMGVQLTGLAMLGLTLVLSMLEIRSALFRKSGKMR
jgi:hypothetical protein